MSNFSSNMTPARRRMLEYLADNEPSEYTQAAFGSNSLVIDALFANGWAEFYTLTPKEAYEAGMVDRSEKRRMEITKQILFHEPASIILTDEGRRMIGRLPKGVVPISERARQERMEREPAR